MRNKLKLASLVKLMSNQICVVFCVYRKLEFKMDVEIQCKRHESK